MAPSTLRLDRAAATAQPSPMTAAVSPAQDLADRYRRVRARTEALAEPLAPEDCVVQTMQDISPTKWHLAHVTWFFETFVLRPHLAGYEPLDPRYAFLFNSYYVQAGPRHARDQRGYLSRPTVSEVYAYRAWVDSHMQRLLEDPEAPADLLLPLVAIGLNHEQQHQELMVTDIKHVFSVNPLRPAYHELAPAPGGSVPAIGWIEIDEGLYEIGHEGVGFCFDNELPRHRHFLERYALADRLVTNAEFQAFMADGGYERPELWLSMGWATREQHHWTSPFYWERREGRWLTYALDGMREVDAAEPVCHVSYFEADAYARWAAARLPTEQEWEVAARSEPVRGNFADSARFHPAPWRRAAGTRFQQIWGDVWEWTRSQYSPYPGYAAAPGALGEYNGKFMCNQFVLRGGSCATPQDHIRASYRNFFPPEACWQFTGIRLARDL